jgi:hypothetical protein
LILSGDRTEEYRKTRTHILERVYLYAGMKYHKDVPDVTEEEAARLPRGVIVGSVAIVGCRQDEEEDCFVWELADPMRYPKPLVQRGVPQPGFWYPKF